MILKQQKITDKISLSYINTDKFKIETLSFSFIFKKTKQSFAYDKFLSRIFSRGTEKYPSISAIDKALTTLYGAFADVRTPGAGNCASLMLNVEFLNNKYALDGTDILGGVIDVAEQILFHPLFKTESFDPNIFEHEKKLILEELDALKSNTRSYAITRCIELFYESEEFPTREEISEMVKSAKLSDIIDFYNSIINNSQLNVFYVGSEDASTVSSLIEKAFAKYSCIGSEKLTASVKNRTPSENSKFGTEKMEVNQGKIAMCFDTRTWISRDNDDYYAALVLNEIFGGSASSKLFLNVREDMGLCYHCSSSFSVYTGIITVSSGFKVEMFDVLKQAVMQQLEEIKQGNISDSEISNAKKLLSNSYKQLNDAPLALHSFYSGRDLLEVSDTIDDSIKKIQAVSTEQIIEIANKTSLESVFFVEGTLTQNGEQEDE